MPDQNFLDDETSRNRIQHSLGVKTCSGQSIDLQSYTLLEISILNFHYM